MNVGYVRALRVERDVYVERGLPDRVDQVDAELARLGVPVDQVPRKRRPSPVKSKG